MEHHFVLHYFAVRGRCEPIIVVLEDAGLPYTLKETTLQDWIDNKASGNIRPQDVPFGYLPVLEVHPQEGDRLTGANAQLTIGETGSILRFLDDYISKRKRCNGPEHIDPHNQYLWCLDMLQDASLFYLNRVFQLTASRDWLAHPHRDNLMRNVVFPFLHSLEFHLTPNKIGGIDSALRVDGGDVNYPRCREVYEAISTKPSVAGWYMKHAIANKPWTSSEYGSSEWIKDAAQIH